MNELASKEMYAWAGTLAKVRWSKKTLELLTWISAAWLLRVVPAHESISTKDSMLSFVALMKSRLPQWALDPGDRVKRMCRVSAPSATSTPLTVMVAPEET